MSRAKKSDLSEEVRQNRKAGNSLAIDAAMHGDPVCGAFFAFMYSLRNNPDAAFLDAVFEDDVDNYDFEEDPFDLRPY